MVRRVSQYVVTFRRRRENRTDYRARGKNILTSVPRFVTRESLKHTTVQIIIAKLIGDDVLVSAHSSELSKFGWQSPSGNIPSAYLTGFLAGHRALHVNVSSVIQDIGLHNPSPRSKIFAALKGALDAGLKISYSDDILPDEARTRGEHIALYAKHLSSTDSELYKNTFSRYLANGLEPENLSEHFDHIKKAITEAFRRK